MKPVTEVFALNFIGSVILAKQGEKMNTRKGKKKHEYKMMHYRLTSAHDITQSIEISSLCLGRKREQWSFLISNLLLVCRILHYLCILIRFPGPPMKALEKEAFLGPSPNSVWM